MRDHIYYVYIMASGRNGTLYIGVTNNLIRRVHEHRSKSTKGFAQKYDCNMLVWFEQHQDIRNAILREKRIKKWRRAWKVEMIEEANPSWNDLPTVELTEG